MGWFLPGGPTSWRISCHKFLKIAPSSHNNNNYITKVLFPCCTASSHIVLPISLVPESLADLTLFSFFLSSLIQIYTYAHCFSIMADPKDVEAPEGAHKEVIPLEAKDMQDTKMCHLDEASMDAELALLEEQQPQVRKSRLYLTFSDPAYFTYVLVAFASMGGLLSGLDQSLISGANLYMPGDLGLNASQASLVSAGMPLGAVAGALILSPANEYLGRRMAIIVSCILYTIGAALEAGAINFGIMFAGRFILGAGVGLEGGTVPVYVAESGMLHLNLLHVLVS